MANPQVAKTGIRGYPRPSPEGSEVVDDGRSRSSLEDALSRHTTHPAASHLRSQPEAAHRPRLELGATVEVPGRLVEAIAQRVAQLLRPTDPAAASPWLDFEQTSAYLGFSRDSLYKLTAARAIPCRKKANGQGLRFHRGELDEWMETAYPRLDRLG